VAVVVAALVAVVALFVGVGEMGVKTTLYRSLIPTPVEMY
jgi:hypothetical protein